MVFIKKQDKLFPSIMNFPIVIVCFSLFLILFLGIGAFAAKASDDSDEDYLLGNRSFGKLFIGLSAGATSNSGWIMTGAVGLGYLTGTYSLLMWLGFLIGDLAFWSIFPDRINRISREQDSQTVPELLGLIIKNPRGKRIITAVVALLTVVFVGAYTAAQFSSAAKTLNAFFGLQTEWGAIISAGAILTYCVTGGIRASIWTDVVQAFVVMFVSYGMLIIGIFAGGGFGEIWAQLQSIDPGLINIASNRSWLSILAYLGGFIALGSSFNLSQPQFLVRLMAGSSPEETKQAKWIYLGFVYSTWLATLLFGITCRVLLPGVSDAEQALPLYAMQNLNPVLVGIVLAGVFSVISSTADSQILVCSSALARDLSPNFSHKMTRRHGVRYQQFVTLLVGIVAVSASIFSDSSVAGLVLFAIGALAGSIAPAMFITIIQRRTNHLAMGMMMVSGLLVAITWRLTGLNESLNEAVPGILAALLVHEIVMRGFFLKSVKAQKGK